MPPLRQPNSLEDNAMKVLVDFFYYFFLDCDIDSNKLRRGIASIRHEIGARMPQKLSAEFYNRLLKELEAFGSLVRVNVLRIGGEVVMDQSINGLDCPNGILASVRPEEVHRIQGIIRLELNDRLPYRLDNFHLEHLTVLEYSECTDSDLKVIGANCPKLKSVNVSRSHTVTDIGLAALEVCPQLQFLSLALCSKITASGLRHFLSVNSIIRRLSAWPDSLNAGFDFREDPNWDEDLSVHESLESFTIGEDFSVRQLLHVVVKFRNLRSITLCDIWSNQLSVIKPLSKLSEIEIHAVADLNWTEFELLLEFVGPQIDNVVLWCEHFDAMKRGVDSVFRLCKNLGVLYFGCWLDYPDAELVVPPFEKLKRFECRCYNVPKLEFGEMPMLEELVLCGFDVSVSQVESIILDHKKFPNLKRIKMDYFWISRQVDLDRLKDIVRSNNLDLKIL